MNNSTGNDQSYLNAYQAAEKRVKAKIGFKWHLASYLVVNSFLIVAYLLSCWDGSNWNWSYPWFVWTLGGWGIGVMFNFLAVYIFPDNHVTNQKMIGQELQRMGVASPTLAPTATYSPSGQPVAAVPPIQDTNL
ncbi:2TM domain-containing protein (plasmid) [Candidatus Chlorohelix allophototropha]|uniref:2TM domain-containing protein n=1 Tax=Candidatus Chlorohelix allophototropha TaxID=3003348 RepID=A0ABY9BB92_9CHLR|nr:2TM domain-containing protein [Chloroflexota bacterium L227-S17]